jgi:5-(carboxyamino)imidazole ribonucleotide synthase
MFYIFHSICTKSGYYTIKRTKKQPQLLSMTQELKIGLLGGGQLGKMWLEARPSTPLNVKILDPDSNCPCRDLGDQFTVGKLMDFDTVYNFGKDCSHITIEIENVNVEALKKLETEGVKIYPQPHLIELIQDKGLQKQFYADHDLPTAPFKLFKTGLEIQKDGSLDFPLVQKLRREGYDGRGVQVLKSKEALKDVFDAPSVLEDAIDIEKEIAVVVVRNPQGEIKNYPPVEMQFHSEANLLDYLAAPARIDKNIAQEAEALAIKLIEKFELVGLLAVEMFITKDGKLLINEVAPRPHNSGHHTIEANATSQYEQYWKTLLGQPLGSVRMTSPAAMVNLLGTPPHNGPVKYEGLENVEDLPQATLHLYGKTVTKPMRKMGHLTVLDGELENAIHLAKEIARNIKIIT